MTENAMEKAADILLVDDSPDFRLLLHSLLGREGYSILEANSGADALNKLQSNTNIKLVLLDIIMPEMDGFAVMNFINEKIRPSRKVKVVFLTSKKDREDVIKGIKLKIDDYIVKPVDPVVLKSKLKTLLEFDKNESEFVWIKFHCRAELAQGPLDFSFTITNFSETRVVFESSLAFIPELIFAFKAEKLASTIEEKECIFTIRTDSCEQITHDRYRSFATFVGLPESTQQKLRLYAQKNAGRKA